MATTPSSTHGGGDASTSLRARRSLGAARVRSAGSLTRVQPATPASAAAAQAAAASASVSWSVQASTTHGENGGGGGWNGGWSGGGGGGGGRLGDVTTYSHEHW